MSIVAPEPDGKQAAEWARLWWGRHEDKLSAVVRIAFGSPTPHPVTAPTSDLIDVLGNTPLDELVYAGDKPNNLYMNVGYLTKKPERGRRGGKKLISGVPGVWLDLDVKGSGFSDEETALDLLRNMPVLPTLVVTTGSGGVHGYWRCSEVLGPDEAEWLCESWWCLGERISGRKIDKLTNCDRIMRLPGSVRWPKTLSEQPAPVKLLYASEEIVTSSVLRDASASARRDHEEYKRHVRTRVSEYRTDASLWTEANSRWEELMAMASIEDEFASRMSWESILEPNGWTYLEHDDEGRALWTRPGETGRKSATTDWPESPDVMSLFSRAPETGLLELKDAEIPLTKWRVWVELTWRGDEAGAVKEAYRWLTS